MPRMKAVKSDEEAAQVPLTEPVMVELPSAAALPDAAVEKPSKKKEDDPVDDTKKQIEDLRRANDERNTQLMRERDEANQRAAQATQFAQTLQTGKHASDIANVTSQLAAAQASQAAAEQDFVTAANNADAVAMAKAQSKIGRAAAEILNCEALQADLEERGTNEAAQRQNAPQRQVTSTDIMNGIDQSPNLTAKEKAWLKEHQECVIDASRSEELRVAHNRALRDGHARGTDGYFDYLESFLGYKAKDDDGGEPFNNAAAPVNRSAVNEGNITGSRITLTPEQRTMAKSLGVTDFEYAQQLIRLNQDKRENPERYGRTS